MFENIILREAILWRSCVERIRLSQAETMWVINPAKLYWLENHTMQSTNRQLDVWGSPMRPGVHGAVELWVCVIMLNVLNSQHTCRWKGGTWWQRVSISTWSLRRLGPSKVSYCYCYYSQSTLLPSSFYSPFLFHLGGLSEVTLLLHCIFYMSVSFPDGPSWKTNCLFVTAPIFCLSYSSPFSYLQVFLFLWIQLCLLAFTSKLLLPLFVLFQSPFTILVIAFPPPFFSRYSELNFNFVIFLLHSKFIFGYFLLDSKVIFGLFTHQSHICITVILWNPWGRVPQGLHFWMPCSIRWSFRRRLRA